VDRFNLRPHFRFNAECIKAEWKSPIWTITFRNSQTGEHYIQTCDILLSAVGGFSVPREVTVPGMEQYQGKIFHTAQWDHSFDWKNKRIGVIGNGCSAAQVVASIAPDVAKLTQFARSAQWYHPRPNKYFSSLEKFCFRFVPGWQRYHRLDLFLKTDCLAAVYGPSEAQVRARKATEEEAKKYIYSEAPEKYHSFIVPDFPLGCKRRIYDPGYLAALHHDAVELRNEEPKGFTEKGLVRGDGTEESFDAVIMATGFDVQSFLAPMKIHGKGDVELHEQWDAHRGSQAYMGTYVHNFPNFAIL
jgi:cation diffusion facilitator CzcD-associated flavoprotein CzcO